jgi:hypothetical protein
MAAVVRPDRGSDRAMVGRTESRNRPRSSGLAPASRFVGIRRVRGGLDGPPRGSARGPSRGRGCRIQLFVPGGIRSRRHRPPLPRAAPAVRHAGRHDPVEPYPRTPRRDPLRNDLRGRSGRGALRPDRIAAGGGDRARRRFVCRPAADCTASGSGVRLRPLRAGRPALWAGAARRISDQRLVPRDPPCGPALRRRPLCCHRCCRAA